MSGSVYNLHPDWVECVSEFIQRLSVKSGRQLGNKVGSGEDLKWLYRTVTKIQDQGK